MASDEVGIRPEQDGGTAIEDAIAAIFSSIAALTAIGTDVAPLFSQTAGFGRGSRARTA